MFKLLSKALMEKFDLSNDINWILAFQVTHKQIPQVFFFNFYSFCIFLEIFQSDITDILLYFISLFIFQRPRRNEFVVYKYFPLFQKKKSWFILLFFTRSYFLRCKYFLLPKKFNNWKRNFFVAYFQFVFLQHADYGWFPSD